MTRKPPEVTEYSWIDFGLITIGGGVGDPAEGTLVDGAGLGTEIIGMLEGAALGCTLGSTLGCVDGCADECIDGCTLGCMDGCALG